MSINEQNLKKSLADKKKNNNEPEFSVHETENIEPKKDKDISQKILAIDKENNRLLKKIVRYQRLETLFSLLKILVIVVPLIFAYIYLAPMFEGVIKNYQELLGTTKEFQTTTGNLKELENIDIQQQLKEIGEKLK